MFFLHVVLQWFSHLQTGKLLTVRDLLSWIEFINVTEIGLGSEYACLHGLFLILLDGLNLGTLSSLCFLFPIFITLNGKKEFFLPKL